MLFHLAYKLTARVHYSITCKYNDQERKDNLYFVREVGMRIKFKASSTRDTGGSPKWRGAGGGRR